MRKSLFRKPSAVFGSGRGWFLLVVLVVLAAIIAFRLFAPGAFVALSSPLFSFGQAGAAAVDAFFDSFADARALSQELSRVRKENEELLLTNDMLAERIKDIEALLAAPISAGSFVLAGVLSGPPLTPYDTLLLNAGTENGIRVGAYVYGPEGVPLGTIEDAAQSSAHAVLYSSPGRETPGWLGEERTALLVRGDGAGAFEAALPKDALVSLGDTVYLPGPGAIPVGTVARIVENPSSPEKRIHIRPTSNLFSVTWVLVASDQSP